MGKFAEYRNNKKKKEEGNTSSSGSFTKFRLENQIGFDTFESDLKSIGETIGSIYGGWQTQETMSDTRGAVEAMRSRLDAYQTYQKKYGGTDLSEVASGYKSILDDWDNLTSAYGHYQNADAYDKAMKKSKLDKDFAGLTYDEVQAKKKEYGFGTEEYAYLNNYTNYSSSSDFEKALNSATSKKVKDKLTEAKNIYDLDHVGDKWLDVAKNDDFADTSKYEKGNSELYEYINNVNGARENILYAHDKIQAGSPIYTPSKYTEMGLDAMTDEEIGIYNTLYAQDKANGTNTADEYLSDIEKVLTKRISDKQSESIKNSADSSALESALLSIASPIMNVGGGIYSGIESIGNLLKGESGNPYSIYNSVSNMASDIRTEVGENIAENTQGMDILGVNVPSFLYNTGMSIADSALGAFSLGKAYTPLMGMSAYQQTAKELTEAGASKDEIMITSLVSGLAEAGFEYAGIDNLFKTKGSDSIKSILTNTLKQMGAEAGEEVGTEIVNIIADTWIRNNSEYKQMYEELIARGFSEQEASLQIAKDIGGRVAQAGIGGALSGGVMGGVFSTVQHHDLKSTGAELRANDRTQDVMSMFTPEEAETYKLYSEYAGKGVTADNISDAQLGNLYETKASSAYDTYASKKSTAEQKESAMRTLDALSTYRSTPNTKLKATGEKVDIKGVKEVDGDTVLVTNSGEVSAKDVSLSSNHAELLSLAENMSEEKANLFIEQYDGTSNVEAYKDSFEMAYAYGETGFGADSVLKNRGVLTEAQASAIYKRAITNKVAVQQKTVDEINAKYGKTVTVAGKFDDSIIDYNNTTTDGSKVNWNSLTSKQRDAITFAKGFSEATGVNVTFIKSDVVDGKRVGKNGSYNPETNSIEIDVYAGVVDASAVNDSIIPTISHEVTHWMKAKAPAMYSKMREHIMETLAMDGKLTSEERVAQEMERIQKNHPDVKVTEEMAIDEIMARACEDMLSNSDTARKMLNRMSKKEQNSFVAKVKETFDNIMKWVNELLAKYKSTSNEAEVLRQYKDRLKQLSKMWDKALAEAVQTNQAMQNEGITDLDIDVLGYDGLMYNLRAEEMHKEKLEKNYSEEADIELDALMKRYNKILDIWKKLGGELNSQFLEEWDNKVGKDRTFTIFKAQAGYKYNVELSSMCKKGVPLFEAIDKIITKEVLKELKTDTIGKAEKEILYDILKTHNFEIPCAICYVEQARQREGNIINAFIDGKVETNANGKVTYRKIGWNQTLENVQKEMKANGVDYTFPSLSRDIATDNYSPADISMDEETQIAFYNALKKLTNEEIKLYNKEKKKNRPLIKDVTPSALKVAFKGKLPDNIMLYKTLFSEPSSRFIVDKDLLYSSATTRNLSLAHHEFYKLFNTQGGVNGYKTKQGTVVYWGDMLSKTWKPSTIRNEGGIRNQSNSDFQMYTLLDQAQMYIDFSAKGYYLQAYTKVLAELKLFGLSNGKINASLIPKVVVYKKADGTIDVEKTMENAGLDENGNPIFDDIEGVGHKEAFMLIEDAEYSKSICGVCIGYSDNHISTLLDDSRVQLIIGFHDKTDDGSKRYKGARYATNYNGRNEAIPKNNADTNVHIGFNQFIKKAESKFKYNEKTGKSLESVTYNGKTYKPNDIPRLATDLYLEHCENKGLYPAYSQGGVDFSKHPNYYKLLADFGLYDSQGNYAPHKKVAYNMPDQVPYLDANGNKAYMKTEDYIKAELEKELLVRDSIAEALADQSEEGIIPQFINRVNEMYSDRDYMDAVNKGDMETAQKMVDETAKNAGYTIRAYHGTNAVFNVFDKGKLGQKNFLADSAYKGFFASKSKETAENYTGLNNADMVFLSDASREELERIKAKHNFDKADKEYKEAREKFEDEYRNAHGYKEAVTDYIDRISEHAEMLGLNESAIRDLKMSWEYRWNSADSGDGRNNISRMAIEFSETKEAKEYKAFNQKIYDEWEQSELDRRGYKPNIKKLYLKIENPLVHDFDSNGRDESFSDLIDEAKKNGNDGCIFKNVQDGGDFDDIYVVFDNTQLKSADAVTYDDNGNVIPLSKRFDASNEDIRYSDRETNSWLDATSIDDILADILANHSIEELIDDEMFLDEDYSDELSVEDAPKKVRAKRRVDVVNKRLKEIGLSFNGTKTLAWTDERIDEYLSGGYYGASNPKYAQAYIAYMTPQQFLNLTVGGQSITLDIIENESATYGDVDIEKLGKSLPMWLDIKEGKVWSQVTSHEGRHRMLLLGKAGFEKVPVLLFDNRTIYTKTAKSEMKLIAQKPYDPELLVSKSRNVTITDVIPFSQGNRDLIIEKFGSGKDADIHYSDRDNTTIYDLMGENKALQKQNAKLEEDINRLKERLKLEKQVTHGNTFNENQLHAVAKHLRKSANSTYAEDALVEELRDVYTYIVTSPQIDWSDLMARCSEVAQKVLKDSKGYKVTNDYYKSVLEDIRRARIALNDEQVQEARYTFGDRYRDAFMGRVLLAKNGTSLDQKWSEWSAMYPEIFDADIPPAEQIVELSSIYDALKEGAETYQQYNDTESIRAFAVEIYNQYWNVSTIRTTADKYDKQIKKLNFEHRTAMNELRADYKKRVEDQKKADAIYYGKKLSEIRKRRDADVKQAKELGKKRLDAYKDRVDRNAKIKSITEKSLTLNKWLIKNSRDEHIPEVMKAPVAYLLNAIDFSSKQLLGVWGGNKAGTPTRKDISLSKALEQVHDMVKTINSAQIGEDEITEIYGTFADFPMGFADDIKDLSSSVNDIMRAVGDNAYVLNDMTLEQLESLDKIVTTIKATVTKMNKFLAIRHAEGVANLSQTSILYMDSLGKAKERGKVGSKIEKMLDWNNSLPYYTFKRFGEGGQKVYEALQDGWDKFAFHLKDIMDYAEATYTSKEVKEWSEEVREFDVLEPATDEQKADPSYKPRYQKVQMTVPQIMSLYCLQKREQAKSHLFGGGMRIADFEVKGKKISQTQGAILSDSELDNIINSLTDRHKAVADALQEYMNTTCTDWGNEVSMLRFGYKAFGEENYFPIQSDKNNLAVNDETEQNNSLFRLLNMSFTKGTIKNANNRVVVSDIFDVFAQHSSDMAKYNALALPVLDSFKWYNYKEKIKKGETQFTTKSLKESLESAFGKDAQNYIVTFLRDINGQQSAGRDVVGKGFSTNAKLASVGFNMRVVALQPTSYLRASAVIDNKYLTKAFLHKPKMDKAQEHCGIALWKSFGFYDINVQNNVTDLIKHNQTFRDKVVDASMKGAEIADKVTWGYLWNACELEARDKQKNLKVGSKEFYEAVAKRLREVIYSTQVVDSTMTRSHMMRSTDRWDKMATAFMSEPTLSYNMLQDAYMDWKITERQTGSAQKAFKANGKKMARVFTAYTVTNMICALVEAGFDVYRDEEEMTPEEFIELYLKNLASNMSIISKIPYAKEVVSMLQGYSSSRTDTQWMQYFTSTITGIGKLLEGKGNAYTTAKNAMRALSYVSGIPFYNVWRDSTALLDETEVLTAEDLEEMFNETIGEIFPSLKSK